MSNQIIDKNIICSFFRIEEDAGPEEIERIQKAFESVVFEHNQTIIEIDTEPDFLYYLESGIAGVYDRNGKQVNLMHRGVFFGEYGALSGEKRLTTVKAEGKVVCFRMSRTDLMEIMAKHPGLFSETMKRVYNQLSNKHERLIELSKTTRGKLQTPKSQQVLQPKQLAIQYGSLIAVFILTAIFVPATESASPLFLFPLVLMIAFALITRRTFESLIISGVYASLLLAKMHMISAYTDAVMNTMINPGNVFTVLVMALMGGFVTLVEASGSLTAFKKLMAEKVHTKKGAMLGSAAVLLLTAVDDCLNLICASTSMRNSFDKCRVSREESSVLMSFLPVTLCSFIPVSLWSIYVVANINTGNTSSSFALFCKAIPFNFYSIIVVIAMLLLCFGVLPKNRVLSRGIERVKNGGSLYPEGSFDYLYNDEDDMCGKILNLLLPIFALAISSLAVRSLHTKSFIVDSACGLVCTLLIMFFCYCGQRIMTPEQFLDNLVAGIQSMVLPIAIYLVTMCFSQLLTGLNMELYFDEIALSLSNVTRIIPAGIFLLCSLLTTLLGSSWAMFVLGFPLVLRLVSITGINLPLCIGAVCAAGISGEKNCLLTSDAGVIATALGINPSVVLRLRVNYSLIFSILAFIFYLVSGTVL